MDIRAKLARQAVEHYLKHRTLLSIPETLPAPLKVSSACYVTLYYNPGRRLRARYGEPLPQMHTLAEEIIANATIAATLTTDHRRKLSKLDLPSLKFGVTVIGALQRISEPEHLNTNKFGVYAYASEIKKATVLPGRPGVITPNDQIATVYREANIDPRQDAVTLYRFATDYFE